jgi:Nif-specific regulatory protein
MASSISIWKRSRFMGGDGEHRLRQERDLYHRLLDLGTQQLIEPFLAEALALVVEVTGAQRGYLELRDELADSEDAPWWMAQGCSSDDLGTIRDAISRGIIAEAIATGQTVVTSSALLDPRFRKRESVRSRQIQAVLCAPVGGPPPIGVFYLEGAEDTGPWSDEDRERAETFARHLAPLADRLLDRHRTREREDATRGPRQTLRLAGVVGRSAALASVLEQAAMVAPLDVNVLLTGDSGTGKSQLARVIHENGGRAGGPFVEVNCAALPESLIESELFGAARGAHSTAHQAAAGKVEAASRGTLFLDEVGELPISAQAKLLQLLQSKQYYPLGSNEAVSADVRLIAATNTDLEVAVSDKRFREDLYYRLCVLPIRMPTLAERPEDVGELAAFFCAQTSERHRLPRLELSEGARRAIEAAEWPGNVRQLAHTLEAATIRAAGKHAARVERRHVFPDQPGEDVGEAEEHLTYQEATRRFQRRLLHETLVETGWNVSEAARRLDLARSHVYKLIHGFGMDREDTVEPSRDAER